MNTLKSLIFLAICIASITSLNLKSQISMATKQRDFIVNGGFENPSTGGGWQNLGSIEGWTATNDIEVGRGSIYVGDWGNTQITELDTHGNTKISQKINFEGHADCRLAFKWAARTGNESSSMVVTFNGEQVFSVSPNDSSIHQENVAVKAHQGENEVSFAGTGSDDSLGMTLDDVQLLCFEAIPDPAPLPVPAPVPEPEPLPAPVPEPEPLPAPVPEPVPVPAPTPVDVDC